MTLKQTKEKGFTIVELLIVVVIIAILAAITIVAYSGIQNRAKASSAQSLANAVAKKAEAFNATESSYPANVAGFGTGAGSTGNPAEAKLDDATKVKDAEIPTNEKTVSYKKCSTGAQVIYYDMSKTTAVSIGMGGQASVASSATLCS